MPFCEATSHMDWAIQSKNYFRETHQQTVRMKAIFIGCAIITCGGFFVGFLLLQLWQNNESLGVLEGSVFRTGQHNDSDDTLDSRLVQQLMREVRELRAANKKLEAERIDLGARKCVPPPPPFSREHELERRELQRHIWELYLRLSNTQMPNPVDRQRIDEQLVHLLAQSSTFAQVGDPKRWHKGELDRIGARIQSAIQRLQNPKDCASARLMRCEFNAVCGFGCQLHHLIYCFVVALTDNRTTVIEDQGQRWRYSNNSGGWTSVFEPISTCTVAAGTNTTRFVRLGQPDRIVDLPHEGAAKLDQLPLAFPRQFADQLLEHHSFPPAFFIGQLDAYLMREKERTHQYVQDAIKRVPFDSGPVVGLHIRRTDKELEAPFHSLDEYMRWAELWFRVEQLRRGTGTGAANGTVQRRVYIATDERAVIEEARRTYEPRGFQIYTNDAAAGAAAMDTRYSDASLLGLVADIRILSRCAHLVCTFSSQIGRLAYELMQVEQGDAGAQFHSLDGIFYVGGGNTHEFVALDDFRANASTEIDLKRGDIIEVTGTHWNAGNRWDGFSKGTNPRINRTGLFPSYLVRERWRIADFAVFEQNADEID